MEFVEKIDELIRDMTTELQKVRAARHDKDHHANYVAEKVNKIIREESKTSPDNPVIPLGKALSEVGNIICESFDHLDKIESNIIVTINAYSRVKNEFVACENKEKQEEAIALDVKDQKVKAIEEEEPDTKKRSVGKRPTNKIRERAAKPKPSRKKKKSKKNLESKG